jgi:glycosyltransferase involved in cell wall biosynthesis
MKKLSIITAVHNQIEYNRLFIDSLQRHTHHPYELIIVDNASHDGSADLFEQSGAIVVRNEKNLCYGCSQNQGLARATAEFVAFLNNDICVSGGWDKALIEYLERYDLDAISPCGIETMESPKETRRMMRKWRRINAVQRMRAATGMRYTALHLRRLVHRMYGDWDTFTKNRRSAFSGFLYPGISGNAVVARRNLFEAIGPWSTAVAATDWDLQLRLVKAQTERGRPKQCMIAGEVFVHHFIRTTARAKPSPRGCDHPLVEITAYYSAKDLVYLNRPSASVVVAVYERPDFLERVFAGLHNQTFKDFEVVVADDGSGPAVAALIAEWQGRFRYPIAHVWQEHRGFRKTVVANKAAVQSRSDYLCFIDGDAIPHRMFLHSHMAARRIKTVLSGRRAILDKELTQTLSLDDIRSCRLERMSFRLTRADAGTDTQGIRAPIVSALRHGWRGARGRNRCLLVSNFSVFKGDFYRVNGFEESNAGRGLEDNGLGDRFKLAGVRMRTAPRFAIQYQLYHESNPVPRDNDAIARYRRPETFWAEEGIMQ